MRRLPAALLALGLAVGGCGDNDDGSDRSAALLALRPVLETTPAPCGDRQGEDHFVLAGECLELGDPIVDADDVRSATVGETAAKEPAIAIVLGNVGSTNLDRHAAANQGKRLAIVADGRLVNAPVLNFSSFAGRIQVTGLSKDETEALLRRLNEAIKPG